MFCALLGQDIRRAFTGTLVLWFNYVTAINMFKRHKLYWLRKKHPLCNSLVFSVCFPELPYPDQISLEFGAIKANT